MKDQDTCHWCGAAIGADGIPAEITQRETDNGAVRHFHISCFSAKLHDRILALEREVRDLRALVGDNPAMTTEEAKQKTRQIQIAADEERKKSMIEPNQPHRFLLVEFWCESTTEDEEVCRERLMTNLCATMEHLEKEYPELKYGVFNHFPTTHVPGL